MNNSENQESVNREHDWIPGFEFLRVLFIVFVLCMHTNLTQLASGYFGCDDRLNLFDVVRFNLLCAAVPGLLIISTFLQARKRISDWRIQKNHIVDLCYLYAFWVGVWVLLTRSRPSMSISGILEFIMRGGGWVFYYFFVLIIVHLLVMLFNKSKNSILLLGLIASLAINVIVFCVMHVDNYAWTRLTTYWWPISFIPTPFIGMLLSRYENKLRLSSNKIFRWAGAGIIFLSFVSAIELGMAPQMINDELRGFLPEYLRLTPIVSATILIICSFYIRKSYSLTRFLSHNALGIFCLHVFYIGGIGKITDRYIHDPLLAMIACIIMTIITASILSEVMRIVMKSRLV